MDFNGKVVLITGAASGIGASSAYAFASKGAQLSLVDINGDWQRTVADKCSQLSPNKAKIFQTVGDLTDKDFREKLVNDTIAQFGKLDILLNIAGIWIGDSVLKPNLEAFDKNLDLNTRVPYHLSSLCVPYLIKTKGNIVNVSSVTSIATLRDFTSYSMSKSAVDTLTKHMAHELAQHGVRSNSIRPGFTYTNIGSAVGQTTSREFLDTYKFLHGLNRLADPSEIADTIAYIASDKCKNMTGTCLTFDSGLNTHRLYPDTI